jgi:phage baseplate assembly protein W
MYFNFPFKIDGLGHTAQIDYNNHIRQLIEQVLFTQIGERVNRPSFGTNINHLLFAPNSDELATSTSFLIQGALQLWLGDLIDVVGIQTKNQESLLFISISYIKKKNSQQQKIETVEFKRQM